MTRVYLLTVLFLFLWTIVMSQIPCGIVIDYDGNTYKTVQLGNQCWMAENLRTKHYADGTSISVGIGSSYSEAYWYYPDGKSSNAEDLGLLYNWPAVMWNDLSTEANPSGVQGICPDGWHLPSSPEWEQLRKYVRGQDQFVCGGNNNNIAKALAAATGWESNSDPCAVGNNQSANNTTGFDARPAGIYDHNNEYNYINKSSGFWCATGGSNLGLATCYHIDNSFWEFNMMDEYFSTGLSVRCVQNKKKSVSITTSEVSEITFNTAITGGVVVADEGEPVSACGVCWSTSRYPTVDSNHIINRNSAGTFTSRLSNLQESSLYYVRAYAIIQNDTIYGDEVYFSTKGKYSATDGRACLNTPTLKDYDGNVYGTVQLGSQCWMAENLRTTHYADGTSISNGAHIDLDILIANPEGCYYLPNNKCTMREIDEYGLLYNWFAAARSNAPNRTSASLMQGVCPNGWHLPSQEEWGKMLDYVGNQSSYICGGERLNIAKALSGYGWDENDLIYSVGCNRIEPNEKTGFNALPAGNYRSGFEDYGNAAVFWYSDFNENSSSTWQALFILSHNSHIGGSGMGGYKFYDGCSVRCVRNADISTAETKVISIKTPENIAGYNDKFSQLYPFFDNDNNQFGYKDTTGKIVIPARFDEASHFSEGLARVRINEKYEFINEEGKEVILPQFDIVHFFVEGLAAISINGKWGFINKTGQVVIQPSYDEVTAFNDGIAGVRVGDFWGFIDKTGIMIVQPKFKSLGFYGFFSDDLCPASLDGEKFGYIDKTGKFVIAPQFWNACYFYGGIAKVDKGFIDKTGKKVHIDYSLKNPIDAVNLLYGGAEVGLNYSSGAKNVFTKRFSTYCGASRFLDDKMYPGEDYYPDGLPFISINNNNSCLIEVAYYNDYTGWFKVSFEMAFEEDQWKIDNIFNNTPDERQNYSESLQDAYRNGITEWDYMGFDTEEEAEEVFRKGAEETIKKLTRQQIMDSQKAPISNPIPGVCVAVVKYRQDSVSFAQCKSLLQDAWQKYNKQILDYPYNTDKTSLDKVSLPLEAFGKPNLQSVTNEKIKELQQQVKVLQDKYYSNLKTNNPEKFAEVYLQEHPEHVEQIEKQVLECRCKNISKAQMVIMYIDKKIPNCTCRKDYYSAHGHLFANREDFDETYNIGEKEFLDNILYRQKLRADIEDIKTLASALKNVKLKDGLESKNGDIHNLAQKVQYHKDKYYYKEVVDLMFEYDENMVKEWEKNGLLFKSKVEFYEAYVSGEYKNVLKEKKK